MGNQQGLDAIGPQAGRAKGFKFIRLITTRVAATHHLHRGAGGRFGI